MKTSLVTFMLAVAAFTGQLSAGLDHKNNATDKKVLFVVPGLVRGGGGLERALVNLLSHMPCDKNAIDVCVLSTIDSYKDFFKKNVHLISLDAAKKNRYETVVSFAQWIRPDVWLSIHAKKRVQWLHANVSALTHCPFSHLRQCKGIDTFVCVSDGVEQDFWKLHPQLRNKTCTIRNISDSAMIRAEAEAPVHDLPCDHRVPLIVTVARLWADKGIDRAVEVCKRLRDDGERFHWIVVGEGNERPALEKYIAKHHLQHTFYLLGSRENPYPYIKICDIFALTSYYEGYGLVIAEAKSLAKPVISTDVAGARDQLISGLNGLIVANNKDALYKGLKRLLHHETECARYAAALDNFTVDNSETLAKIEQLFRSTP